MAGTDQDGIVERQRDVLPPGWFPTSPGATPILGAVLAGFAAVGAWLYSLVQYGRNQARISTSTDGWLELGALDYFGDGRFPRFAGETDLAYAARIQANLLPKADTRQAVSDALKALTGVAPRIVEPWQPNDTGVWNGVLVGQWDDGLVWDEGQPWDRRVGGFYWNVDTAKTPFRWTSVRRRYQAFIETPYPSISALGNNFLPAWNRTLFWNKTAYFMDLAGQTALGRQAVIDAILKTKVEGTLLWLREAPAPTSFTLDLSPLDGDDTLV